jgi:hypothetical protein
MLHRRPGDVKRIALLAALVSLAGCGTSGERARLPPHSTSDLKIAGRSTRHADDWHLDPGDSNAVIAAQSSEAELRERFGKTAISSARVELGEGETTPGTVLFAEDSVRRLEIVWQDTVGRRRPARIIIRGERSKWQVGPGVSLDTSLAGLERLNGKPFTLAGFGWDYAGVVTSWNGGALDSSLAGVKLYLDPGAAQYESAPYSQVLGDRDYSSDLPAMRQLSPKVRTIFVDFESR